MVVIFIFLANHPKEEAPHKEFPQMGSRKEKSLPRGTETWCGKLQYNENKRTFADHFIINLYA